MICNMLPADSYKVFARKLPHMNFIIHGSKSDRSQLWITCDCMDDDFTLAYPVGPSETLVETISAMLSLANKMAVELAAHELQECLQTGKNCDGEPFWLQ